jgi:hypothetical protein
MDRSVVIIEPVVNESRDHIWIEARRCDVAPPVIQAAEIARKIADKAALGQEVSGLTEDLILWYIACKIAE